MRFFLAFLLLLPLLADAQPSLRDSIGQVITTRNDAALLGRNGLLRIAQRRADVYIGDKISTGPNVPLQMRMRDQSNIRIACNSELDIQEYSHDQDSRWLVSLGYIRGGLMIVSNAAEGDLFRFTTPIGEFELSSGVFEIEQETSVSYLIGIHRGALRSLNNDKGLRLDNVSAESFLRISLNGNVETIVQRDLLRLRERNCSPDNIE
jgi:hypothetical protein